MKRGREERPMPPQVRRRPDSSGTNHSSDGQQRLTTEDALSYLKRVKEKFSDRRETYDEFLEVMKAFKAQRVDTSGVIDRVKELFKGHRSLILGFNTFLPKGYEITLPEEFTPKKPVDYQQAIEYVNKIKARFQNDEEVYKNFLSILNLYRQSKKSIAEVYQEVQELFRYDEDLLTEFATFLPDASGTHRPPGLPTARPTPGHTSGVPSYRISPKDTVVKLEKNNSLQNNLHQNVVKEEKVTVEVENEPWKKVDKEKEPIETSERKEKERGEKRSMLNRDKDFDSMFQPFAKRKSTRIEPTLKQTQIGQSGACNSQVAIQDNKKSPLTYFRKVRSKLNDHAYGGFLRCLELFNKSIVDQEDLKNLLVDVFGNYSDLVEELNDVISMLQDIDFDSLEEDIKKFVKADKGAEKDGPNEKDLDDNGRVKELERERERDRDKERHFKTKDMLSKPISELDLSNCETCTPSYRLLPKNYTKSVASFRTELGKEVLNDKWVSVTSGSEDYSFQHMRRNQYEESLFLCEDDRFELDMVIESTTSTIGFVNDLLTKFKMGLESPANIDKHWTAMHRRCIERIYGDHGFEFVESARKDPMTALPIILKRLEQKRHEWLEFRAIMNNVWKDVYAKNYTKSLDHRSFYFKQQDCKNLSTKALLNEIKELHEKKKKEEEICLAMTAKNDRPLFADMKLQYADVSIHDDLFRIIKYSCDEICSSTEQANKLMSVWTMFIERLLGVPLRSQGTEDTEDIVNIKNSNENTAISAGVDCSGMVDGTKANDGIINISSKETIALESQKIEKEEISAQEHHFQTTGINPNEDLQCSVSNGGQHSVEMGPYSKVMYPLRTESSISQPIYDSGSGTGLEVLRYGWGSADVAIQSSHNCPILEQVNDNQLLKTDKEEGELSPTPSFRVLRDGENIHCGTGVNIGKNNSPLPSDQIMNKNYTDRNKQGKDRKLLDHDVEDRVGSAPKSADDSDHAFDAAEDVSMSISENEDDCSNEDNEEDADRVDGGKAESEGEAEVGDAHDTEEVDSLPLLDRFSHGDKPLTERAISTILNSTTEKDCAYYGNDAFYVLFRLHQILYDRLLSAKTNASVAEQSRRNVKDTQHSSLYTKFLTALFSLLDGSADNSNFEDKCRAIIGTQSYMLFTLDKLIFKLVKQLQIIASDEIASKLLQLQLYEKSRSPGKFHDAVYHANVCASIHGENIYRFEFLSNPPQLIVQIMDDPEKFDCIPNVLEPTFSNYLHNELLAESEATNRQSVFCKRTRQTYKGDSNALKDTIIFNGLEHKISCSTSKASYVMGTEDFLYKPKRRKIGRNSTTSLSICEKRASQFHKILEASLKEENGLR